MNDAKKIDWFTIVTDILIFIFAFTLGFFINQGRGNTKIADAQATVESLGATVTELNKTIELANTENERLRKIYEEDRARIGELETTNIELSASHRTTTELIEQQRNLIREITIGDSRAGESSSEITEGLGEAISTIDSIIQDIQERED